MAQEGRLTRRMVGVLAARLPEAKLAAVEDPRKRRGRRWKLVQLLTAVVVGLAAGCKSLLEVESLTASLSLAMRRQLKLARRVADTTLRDALIALAPDAVRPALHAQVKAAHRRKALEPEGLPFGVVAMDGKGTALEVWDEHYAQRFRYEDGKGAYGLLRTISCCLVSARAKVCLDAIPLLSGTGEMGAFRDALTQLLTAYRGLKLFQLVSYDAGACGEENADFVVAQGLHYLWGIKDNQPGILERMNQFLGQRRPESADASTEDIVSGNSVIRRVYLVEKKPLYRWSHARTFIRVDSETLSPEGTRVSSLTRYFLSSMERHRLTSSQWLLLARRHWAVENNLHHTLDTAFQEDDFPVIPTSPRAALVVFILRRIAFNLLALFRSVTQKSEERRATPWKQLLRGLYLTLVTASEADTLALRLRSCSATS